MSKEVRSYSPVQSQAGLRIPQPGDFPGVLQRIGNQKIDPYAPFLGTDRVTYQANELCQQACGGCFLGEWLTRDGKVYLQNKRKIVPWELFLGHIEALGIDLKEFFLLGAEATMTPDLSRKMLQYAQLEEGLDIMAVTNGAARPEIFDRTFLALGPNAMHKLNISVDSMDSTTHDALRGKQGALAGTLHNLKRYLELGFPVKAQMTVFPKNYPTILESVQMLYHSYGVRKFAFHCGSIEGVPDTATEKIDHLHPLAWRALMEQLIQFRDQHVEGDDSLTEFNIPFVAFTEFEMRRFIIGNDAVADEYFAHVDAVENGSTSPMPFIGCPAAGHENGRPPQVYLYANDGPEQQGQLSVCQIHSGGHSGMHYAQFNIETGTFDTNQDPATSQMLSIKQSPHFCPAMRNATGSRSDRVMTEKGPLYYACRYPSSGQVPYTYGQFSKEDYRKYVDIYNNQIST